MSCLPFKLQVSCDEVLGASVAVVVGSVGRNAQEKLVRLLDLRVLKP